MSRNNRTKDENFILSLCEEAEKTGNPESPINRYCAGDRANLHPKAVDTICKLLVQANFIKKFSETEIYLTPHGLKLVTQIRITSSKERKEHRG